MDDIPAFMFEAVYEPYVDESSTETESLRVEDIPAFMFEAVYEPYECEPSVGEPSIGETDIGEPSIGETDIGENDVFTDELPSTMSETFYDTNDVFNHEPSAPLAPTCGHGLLTWFLVDDLMSVDELTPALISELESMWFKITGHPFAMYLAEVDLMHIIQNLQIREQQICRFYNEGYPVARSKMMELHARFFDEFGCRISDFHNNESFKRMIDSLLAEQLV
jgi:hypothetical protein